MDGTIVYHQGSPGKGRRDSGAGGRYPSELCGRTATRPGANGVVGLTPFEFLDWLTNLVPPPRKHRHRYHGVFAPNHKLRRAVTALAIGRRGQDAHGPGGGGVSA